MSREDALAEFIRHQFHPLAARDELSRHFRIFNWEAVRPTTEYRKLLSEEAAPFLGLAVDVVGRFMPDRLARWPMHYFYTQPRTARQPTRFVRIGRARR